MKAALRDSYVEFVVFMGLTEKYPMWFEKEMEYTVVQDESRYTFWIPQDERKPDYWEKELIEDDSVFIKKSNGEVHVTDSKTFIMLYQVFKYDDFTNSGIAAFEDDCIEYVECQAGVLPAGYPAWFYEYFTEAINLPGEDETIFFYDADKHDLVASRDSINVTVSGEVTVVEHCVFLRNKFGEIMGMRYDEFLKYYDPEPEIGGK